MYIKKPFYDNNAIASYEKKGLLKPDNQSVYIKDNILSTQNFFGALQTTGSDKDIQKVLEDYYNKKTTLEDIKSIQAIGDSRISSRTNNIMMQVASHSTFYGDYNSSGTISALINTQWDILDFNHDILVTPINGIEKALITIQLQESCPNQGYLKSSGNNSGGQEECSRRVSYCNTNFYNALGFKNQVKQVVKQNCKVYNSETLSTTNDYCFLPSFTEVFDFNSDYTMAAEGEQYSYFEITSNRIKDSTGGQYLRSPYAYSSLTFCSVTVEGIKNHVSPNNYSTRTYICVAL